MAAVVGCCPPVPSHPRPAGRALADDDTSLAAMLREFLELQGFSVDVLHNAEDVSCASMPTRRTC